MTFSIWNQTSVQLSGTVYTANGCKEKWEVGSEDRVRESGSEGRKVRNHTCNIHIVLRSASVCDMCKRICITIYIQHVIEHIPCDQWSPRKRGEEMVAHQ